jgi:hypothetical protein
MAFTTTTSTHITGAALASGGDTLTGAGTVKYLILPLLSIGLAEADLTDIRKVAFALAEKLYQIDAAVSAANKSTKWRSYRSPGTPDEDGVAEYSYTNRLTVAVATPTIPAE